MISDSSESENGDKTTKKRRLNPIASKKSTTPESEDLILEKALAIMEKKDDEFDIFGQFIASEMRQLTNPSTRFVVKAEIMKIIQKYGYSTVLETTNTQHSTPYQNPNNYYQPFVQSSIYPAPVPSMNEIANQQYNNAGFNDQQQLIHTPNGHQQSDNVGTQIYNAYSAVQNDDCLYFEL